MYGNQPRGRSISLFPGPPPRDITVLLVVLFVNYSLSFFSGLRKIPEALQLTPEVWSSGFFWQLATYPFASDFDFITLNNFGQIASSPIWFLFSLLMIYWFGSDVYRYLGRQRFWALIAWAAGAASVSATAVHFLLFQMEWATLYAFSLMQGQKILLAIFIAAFAVAYANATVYFMFILPVKAKWFLPLTILFAFTGFLTTKDFPGFVGICVAAGVVYQTLTGGLFKLVREWRLKAERKILEARLKRMRGRRGMHIVKPPSESDPDEDEPRGPWVH